MVATVILMKINVLQAWAQAVRHDSTIIILHSGNLEFVCIRHRERKTLYLSDMIDVVNDDSPAYGKLHVGIYIAALRDAIDRVMASIAVDEENEDGNDKHEGEDRGWSRKGEDRGGSRKGKERERDSGGRASKHRKTRNEPGDNDEGIDRCEAHEDPDEQLKVHS